MTAVSAPSTHTIVDNLAEALSNDRPPTMNYRMNRVIAQEIIVDLSLLPGAVIDLAARKPEKMMGLAKRLRSVARVYNHDPELQARLIRYTYRKSPLVLR